MTLHPHLSTRPRRCLATTVLAVAASLSATAAWGDDLVCGAGTIRVQATDPADAATVCDGATAAAAFLARHGVEVSTQVDVQVVRELPAGAPSTAVGCCSALLPRVYLLGYEEYAKRQRFLFDLPPDRVFHAGAAAHEVTHALIAPRFRLQHPSMVAQEYVAYVTMLGSLPPVHRAQLLGLHADEGFDAEGVSSINLLMLDPMRFGVAAYRHFEREADQAGFLDRVLSGAVLSE